MKIKQTYVEPTQQCRNKYEILWNHQYIWMSGDLIFDIRFRSLYAWLQLNTATLDDINFLRWNIYES